MVTTMVTIMVTSEHSSIPSRGFITIRHSTGSNPAPHHFTSAAHPINPSTIGDAAGGTEGKGAKCQPCGTIATRRPSGGRLRGQEGLRKSVSLGTFLSAERKVQTAGQAGNVMHPEGEREAM